MKMENTKSYALQDEVSCSHPDVDPSFEFQFVCVVWRVYRGQEARERP